MRALPAEEKAKIEQLTEGLKLEKSKLERELTKWDESGNDIIILAKKMCMMMMEMSDFTRSGLFVLTEIITRIVFPFRENWWASVKNVDVIIYL